MGPYYDTAVLHRHGQAPAPRPRRRAPPRAWLAAPVCTGLTGLALAALLLLP